MRWTAARKPIAVAIATRFVARAVSRARRTAALLENDRARSTAASVVAAMSENTDLDDDGDLDVLVCNDFGPYVRPNEFFLNQGDGTFVENVDAGALVTPMYCMGLAVDP